MIALCMPHYGNVSFGAAAAFFGEPGKIIRLANSGSVLPFNFNRGWCEALNLREKGVTHFAMLHSDVAPEPGWLTVLKDECDRLDADVVAAVIPLKGSRGLTSTAMAYDDLFSARRLTMREVFMLSETFGSSNINSNILLVNTGCFIADLRKPWVDERDDNNKLAYAFHFRDEIRYDNGKYVAYSASEDWNFSRHLASRGARVYATRKVRLTHDGYPNTEPWGTWETDREAT